MSEADIAGRGGKVVRLDLRVRYHECDVQGIVFNAVYLSYADMACFELWRDACGAYQAVVDRGLETIVVSANVRYHRPARYDDELELEICVTRVGSTSFELQTRIRRDAEQLAEAHVTYVFVDATTLTKTEPAGDLRRVLQDYLPAA